MAEFKSQEESSSAAIFLLLNICSAEASMTTVFWFLFCSQLDLLPADYYSVLQPAMAF